MKGRATIIQDMRRRWPAYVLIAVIWLLAATRLFWWPTPLIPILYNRTDSLPYTFAYVRYGDHTYGRGDLIVYSFDGAAQKFYPGLKRQPFFKVVRGVPGDRITVSDREVFINGERVGTALKYAPKRVRLEPIAPGVIPPGYFYVQGTSRDSFDSRYSISGLVRADQVLAKVKPIF